MISVDGLTVEFGDRALFKDISFQMLREIGNHGIFRRRYIAPARFALACQDFQKGGFPCTVS